jgi:cytochrome c5
MERRMSNAEEHESPIKTPKQLITAVLLAFIVPIAVIVLLVKYVSQDIITGAGTEAQSAEAIAERIKPVAQVEFKDVNAPKVLKAGEQVYTQVCAGCHTSGAAGAPKLGEKGDWGKRLSQGYDTLVKHAIEGIRAMPARGGNPDLDDIEVARAVVHLANSAGANFKAPEPKAAIANTEKTAAK